MWEVIGFEKQFIQREGKPGYEAYNLYVKKSLPVMLNCEGERCKTYWYRAAEVAYVPSVGDAVLIETELRGKYEIVRDIQKI